MIEKGKVPASLDVTIEGKVEKPITIGIDEPAVVAQRATRAAGSGLDAAPVLAGTRLTAAIFLGVPAERFRVGDGPGEFSLRPSSDP